MGKKTIATVAIVACVSGTFLYHKKKYPEEKVSEYESVVITKGQYLETIVATGEIRPQNRLELKPPIPGRIEDIMVNEGEMVKKGQIVAWMSSTERAALLDAARSKGPEELKRWEELYRATPIMAPLDGVVITRKLEPGQSLTTNDPIVILSDYLVVKAYVDETDISKIMKRQKATVTVDAYAHHPVKSTVTNIAYEARTVQNVTMYEIDLSIENDEDFLRSGMNANITFIITDIPKATLVPVSAVTEVEKGKTGTVLIDENGTTKTVQLGLSNGKYYQVLSGLTENETIWVKKLPGLDSNKLSSPFQTNMRFGGRGSRPGGAGGSGGGSHGKR